MSRSFRFLHLPIEIQVIVLEKCIPPFSIHIDEFAQPGKPYWKAAGHRAAGGMVWIPRSLRLALRDTICDQYNGVLRCSLDVLMNHLNPCKLTRSVYCPTVPWSAIKKLDLSRISIDRRPDGAKTIEAGWIAIVRVMLQGWITDLISIKHTVSLEIGRASSPLSLDSNHVAPFLQGHRDDEICNFLRREIEHEFGFDAFDQLYWRDRKELEVVLRVKLYTMDYCLTHPGPVQVTFKIWVSYPKALLEMMC